MSVPDNFGNKFVDTKGAAAITGYSEQTLRSFRTYEKGPPYFKKNNFRVYYEKQALLEWNRERIEKVSPKKNKKC